LPELIAFYEDHADQRGQFEVLAIHDDGVKSFRELDKKLADIKKKYWAGKSLPCPILLDGRKQTHKLYGINSWPSGVLIDPEGRVVGEAGLASLEAKLPALSAEKKWARNRDLQKNVFWSFEPKEYTLPGFIKILERWSQCTIIIDDDAVRTAGLNTNDPLPGMVIGSCITLRSLEQLLLSPHGLGLVPSTDGKTLRLTARPAGKEPVSYLQKLHANELNQRLEQPIPASDGKPARPLFFTNQPLLEAIRTIGHEYELPVALDAKAMQDGRISPETKVSGTIHPEKPRQSIDQMLAPLKLSLQVRHEVVMVIPANP